MSFENSRFSRISLVLAAFTATLVTLSGCAGASSDDVSSSANALNESDSAATKRGVLDCALSFTKPECLVSPSGCELGIGDQKVTIGDDFPSMTPTMGAAEGSPYRVAFEVRGVNADPNTGEVDLTVSDNLSGAVMQTVSSRLSIATIGTGAYAGTTSMVNVPEFTYQGRTFTQLSFGCYAVSAIH